MEKFEEVKAEDFMKIGGEPPPHRKIEQVLLDMGGAGKHGAEFKFTALKAAGWKYDRLTGYAKNPDLAAEVFNKLREALAETNDKDRLLELLAPQSETS